MSGVFHTFDAYFYSQVQALPRPSFSPRPDVMLKGNLLSIFFKQLLSGCRIYASQPWQSGLFLWFLAAVWKDSLEHGLP